MGQPKLSNLLRYVHGNLGSTFSRISLNKVGSPSSSSSSSLDLHLVMSGLSSSLDPEDESDYLLLLLLLLLFLLHHGNSISFSLLEQFPLQLLPIFGTLGSAQIWSTLGLAPRRGPAFRSLSLPESLHFFFLPEVSWTPDFSSCSWFYSAPAIGQKYLISDWSEYPISDWSIILLWVIIFLHNIVVIGQKYLISDWCKFTKSDVWLVSISDFWFVNNCF